MSGTKSAPRTKQCISNPRQCRRQCYQRIKGDTFAWDVSKYLRMIFERYTLVNPSGGRPVAMAKGCLQYWVQQSEKDGYFKSGQFEFPCEDIPVIVKGFQQLQVQTDGTPS